MSGIKYVLIEMIENDVSKMTRDSIIAGVFAGIRIYDPPEDDMLVILEKDKNTTHLLNTKRYNVLSLQKFDGYTKVIHCFKAIEEDQNIALNMLSDIVNDMNAAGRTIESDDNIIDITTYSCIPDDITIIKSGKATNAHYGCNSNNVRSQSIYEGTQRQTCRNIQHQTYKPKAEPEPKYFKRNRKPSKDALEKMEKRISEIKAGTYQVKLPVVEGDDVEIANKSYSYNANFDDEDRNFYMH